MKIKLQTKNCGLRMPPNRAASRAEADSSFEIRHSKFAPAFTLVEIAISLAIIGIALLAIIGVLPWGMSAQRDNRERTVINQDATVFVEAIRNGAGGDNDLTNYVYAITNIQTEYSPPANPAPGTPNAYGWDFSSYLNGPDGGARIIGLLSTPEFTDLSGNPTNNLYSGGFSNHVYAYVRSISGTAVEKPPQDNAIIRGGPNDPGDTFAYRIVCEVLPFRPVEQMSSYSQNLGQNLHELRLTFSWPILPNGQLPPRPPSLTYRVLIPGQLTTNEDGGQPVYFFEPQTFTNAP